MPDDRINEILALYGFENAKTSILRHNENLTYRVDYEDRTYCLRLKNPVSGFDLSVFDNDPELLLKGELGLLNAVGELTDIPVQKPVRSLSGDFVIRTSDGTLASLLCWMDGVPFDSGKRTGQMLISAGRTLAELRKAEETVAGLKAFHRVSYDRKLVERLVVKAEQGAEYLPAEAIRSIIKALEAVARVMDEMDGSEELLIAHADPGFGNLIWMDGNVGLIDWSLSGYAHSYMDIGGLMGATTDREEQKLLLQGWENVHGKADRRYLDAYFALSVLLFVCCQHTRAKEWADWFPAALKRWVDTIFNPLSSGHPIPCIL